MKLSLHPKQSLAFQSEATEILFGGAAGGGKSHFLRVLALALSCAVPGLQVYLLRRKYPDLIANHMTGPTGFPAMLSDWISCGRARINYSDNDIFIGNSCVHLRHCQHEKDKYNFQGPEIHVLLIDEATHFEESMVRYIRSRLRIPESLEVPDEYQDKLPRAVYGTNPGGIGHAWVKRWFIDGAKPLEVRDMPNAEGGLRRQFIPSLLEDNPSLDTEEYEGKLEGLGNTELVKAMRHGLWDIEAGGMFSDVWSRDVHVLPPFDIPAGWSVYRSFDWGSAKPFAVPWIAESNGEDVKLPNGETRSYPKKTKFLIAEYYGWNGNPNEGCKMVSSEIAREIRRQEKILQETICKAHSIRPGPADTNIFEVRDGRSIADEMATAGVSWTKANKGPGSRRNGWEIMRRMFRAGLKQPMEEPGFFIFETCHHAIRTLPDLPRSDRDPEDVDTDSEDHMADAVRYGLAMPQRKLTTSRLT